VCPWLGAHSSEQVGRGAEVPDVGSIGASAAVPDVGSIGASAAAASRVGRAEAAGHDRFAMAESLLIRRLCRS
jgi:hypothetical protein